MAIEKNITMKEFNGTDYNTLYPKTIAAQIPDVYSKTEILTTETLAEYGLTADKLPNDVFQQIKTLIESRAKIQTGSYVGTSTYGESNPCSLTFNFEPKILFIQSYNETNAYGYSSEFINNSFHDASLKIPHITFNSFLGNQYMNANTLGYNVRAKRDGNSIYWYGDTAAHQSNLKGKNRPYYYNYIFLG